MWIESHFTGTNLALPLMQHSSHFHGQIRIIPGQIVSLTNILAEVIQVYLIGMAPF